MWKIMKRFQKVQLWLSDLCSRGTISTHKLLKYDLQWILRIRNRPHIRLQIIKMVNKEISNISLLFFSLEDLFIWPDYAETGLLLGVTTVKPLPSTSLKSINNAYFLVQKPFLKTSKNIQNFCKKTVPVSASSCWKESRERFPHSSSVPPGPIDTDVTNSMLIPNSELFFLSKFQIFNIFVFFSGFTVTFKPHDLFPL